MAEENNAQETPAAGATGAQFVLQRIYLKDLSFEAPQGTEGLGPDSPPKISQDLNTSVNKMDNDRYEVIFKLTINAQVGEKTAFLVEVQQAGLFLIKGMEGPQLAQVLNTMCPQILFPYAREVIDSCAVKGGFPALALPPINFDALFVRAMKQAQAAQAEKNASKEATDN